MPSTPPTAAASVPQLQGRWGVEVVRSVLPELRVLVLVTVVFVAVIALGLLLVLPAVSRLIRRRNEQNPTLAEAIERYVKLTVLLVAIAAALAVGGYGHLLSGSALVIAAATLAIGVAGQAVIGNLVSGLFLVADPEFNVDDWISWEEGEGVVETIRLRVTRVRTANDEVITVPNTTLATSAVWRPYSRDRFRVVVRLGVAHDEDVARARRILRESVAVVDLALEDPAPVVHVDEIGDDALWLRALFWVDDPTREEVRTARSEYLLELHRQLTEAGVAFSPPSEHEVGGEIDVN